MFVFKLVRKLKDGSLAPLFINKKLRFEFFKWLISENHPTKGFAERQGFHCTLRPHAPHLSEKDRVWVLCLADDFELYNRPVSQGGQWVLAQKLFVIREVEQEETNFINEKYGILTE